MNRLPPYFISAKKTHKSEMIQSGGICYLTSTLAVIIATHLLLPLVWLFIVLAYFRIMLMIFFLKTSKLLFINHLCMKFRYRWFHEKGSLSYLFTPEIDRESLLNECTLQEPFIWNQLYKWHSLVMFSSIILHVINSI